MGTAIDRAAAAAISLDLLDMNVSWVKRLARLTDRWTCARKFAMWR
jgi:hypothetical protein